ncbi:MAG TPA: hypothetical protein VLF89_04470 [Candidatus Saccharimonadales bacterium]|nr:hypothetical protein [Candidatus Saccharimonadales bacterium]
MVLTKEGFLFTPLSRRKLLENSGYIATSFLIESQKNNQPLDTSPETQELIVSLLQNSQQKLGQRITLPNVYGFTLGAQPDPNDSQIINIATAIYPNNSTALQAWRTYENNFGRETPGRILIKGRGLDTDVGVVSDLDTSPSLDLYNLIGIWEQNTQSNPIEYYLSLEQAQLVTKVASLV